MNRLFAQMCEENFPRTNPLVMNGLAEYYINRPASSFSTASKAEVYLDKVASSAFNGLIPGLVYHGIERCTPEEEYIVTTRSKNNRRTYDLAKVLARELSVPGTTAAEAALLTGEDDDDCRSLLRFLRKIKAARAEKGTGVFKGTTYWTLSPDMKKLWEEVHRA